MALVGGIRRVCEISKSRSAKQVALRGTALNFCTESQQQSSPTSHSPPSPSQGAAVYGKLFGINENTLKTDILNLFQGCGLTTDTIKFDYDRMFNPLAMYLQFPSLSAFNAAFRENNRKGRWLKLDKVERQQWDVIIPYNGNYVLLHGLPRNANLDDVERFLSGCNYESSSFEFFTRGGYPDAVRMAQVRFPSQIEAINAVIQKNGSFCLNQRILTKLIQ